MVRLTVFSSIMFILSLTAAAFPVIAETEPPTPYKTILPTLTPDDALRINVAFVPKGEDDPVKIMILISTLMDGHVILNKELLLQPNQGISMSTSYVELAKNIKAGSKGEDEDKTLSLRVQVLGEKPYRLFVGYEIHGANDARTRAYIKGAADLLD